MIENLDSLSFEQADKLLEESVRRLEDGNMSLEQSVEEYTIACQLLAKCYAHLKTTKGKIEDVNDKIARLMADQGGYENE